MNTLHAPFDRWLGEAFADLPVETGATCHACYMSSENRQPADLDFVRFHPSTKCCTYVPDLPNFLVGAVLEDGDGDGRQSVSDRISSSAQVTPLGLGVPGFFSSQYNQVRGDVFGRASFLRCPHLLLDGRCGIWLHRNGVCTTWYCRNDRGEVGARFWDALGGLLKEMELAIRLWCARAVLPPDLVSLAVAADSEEWPRRLVRELVEANAGERYRAMWGDWAERREAFYSECWRIARAMDTQDVIAAGGERLKAVWSTAARALEEHSAMVLPERVRCGDLTLKFNADGTATVAGRRKTDGLTLSARSLVALEGIARVTPGVPIGCAIESLGQGIVRQLVDRGVLTPPREG